MRTVCVYCGSSNGSSPAYADAARRLGETLVERDLGLVYGGAHVGLMGVVADAVLAGGGTVVGVIPAGLRDKELAHTGLTELHVVDTMHERKQLMAEVADAFVALPGGTGTLDELFETFTWLQLGLHSKPIGLLDVEGYWRPLVAFLDTAVDAGFLPREHADAMLLRDDPDALLDAFATWLPPHHEKWQ
ncbi:TIGR00730 family Rossman fold protein [Nocardioides mangrovicus]|uniref:Cytokinin riboside 5'-monophosphate phosphoribohydrolase n=1 Tax=Nocardioides mangrovicus TaxID=2478913 RepID=A0A3L8P5M1_9ACTN|nr:TIGR00730 family Rossman fold protein [Nocardioides mangrovicus]RLV49949.1 TIGR00730 family Rossman fold protein [Nocardioides mangrovicus]